ncbi:hypothetical protein LUZ60_001743 [Juncus effusus]|nr:hypothetical protein LUZ60_001743 [Juncus effusus]
MERKRSQKSAAADRLRTLLSSPSPPEPAASSSSSFELDESDLFDPSLSLSPVPIRSLNPELNPSPVPFSRRSSFPRPPEGMLAALPPGSGAAASVSSSPSSTSSSPSSSRMIPPIPKPKRDLPQAHQYQSAPVNVPIVPSRFKTRQDSIFLVEEEEPESKSEEEEEEGSEIQILPPHEMVARSRARESPLTTFSVLEGAGRTLKGRDLRQVRNAVWRRTGFMD